MSRTIKLTLVTLLLVGCGGGDGAEPGAAPETSVPADVSAVPEPTDVPTPVPELTTIDPAAETSQRGNIIKEIGEAAFQFDPEGGPDDRWMEFKVTAIEAGECTEDIAEPPQNGHFIFVNIAASTATEWPAYVRDAGITSIGFNPYDFTIIGADGLTEHDVATDPASYCLPEGEQLPIEVGPGEKVVGTVVLDTANPTGVLVYKPGYAGGGSGWEWEYSIR